MMYLKHQRGAECFAMIGHSTGCQNSVHFLKVNKFMLFLFHGSF